MTPGNAWMDLSRERMAINPSLIKTKTFPLHQKVEYFPLLKQELIDYE